MLVAAARKSYLPYLFCHKWAGNMKPPVFQVIASPSVPQQYQHANVYCCVNEETDTQTPGVAEYANVQMSKDNFISTVGLWPKNRAFPVCDNGRIVESHCTDLDENIPALPMLTKAVNCLYSHSNRGKSRRINLINKVRYPLISSLSNISGKKNHEIFENIEEKCTEMNNDEDRTQEMNIDEDRTQEKNNDEGNHKEGNKSVGKLKIFTVKSFYRLDVTSPLGQVVIRKFKSDACQHVHSDVDSQTSTTNKNTSVVRLRERHITYPVTFKGFSGKLGCPYVHLYSFTRRQKKEFMSRVNTGLNKRSRSLFKTIKPCKVRLTHLSKNEMKKWMLYSNEVQVKLKPLTLEEIVYWTSPKAASAVTNSPSVFFNDLILRSAKTIWSLRAQDFPLYIKHHLEHLALSEQPFAEATTNRIVLYKNSFSDVARTENWVSEHWLSEADNSPVLTPHVPVFTFQQMDPSSSGRYTNLQREIHSLPDITSINVDLIINNAIKYHALCQVSSAHMGQKISNVDRIQTGNFLQHKYLNCH